MRKLRACAEGVEAGLAAAFLSAHDIPAIAEEASGGWSVWVHDEDQIPAAIDLLEELRVPDDPEERERLLQQYGQVAREKAEAAQGDNIIPMQQAWRDVSHLPAPLVWGVMAVCVGLFVLEMWANNNDSVDADRIQAVIQDMNITDRANIVVVDPDGPGGPVGRRQQYPWIPPEIAAGEVWRLITPILLHVGLIHILFNMMVLWSIGPPIERRIGSLHLLAMIVVVAVLSNAAGYYLKLDLVTLFSPDRSILWPHRGVGFSGVIFGFFGYVWIRGKYDPLFGMRMPRDGLIELLVFQAFCFIGLLPIGNTAHVVGLLTGMAWGYVASGRWRRRARATNS